MQYYSVALNKHLFSAPVHAGYSYYYYYHGRQTHSKTAPVIQVLFLQLTKVIHRYFFYMPCTNWTFLHCVNVPISSCLSN